MKIAPIDIAHKQFGRKLMGLDPEEVTEFLRHLADHLEELIRERNSFKESLREKELQIHEYKERDEVLKSTIATAAKMSERIRSDAEREAKIIVHEAEQKAETLGREAREALKRMYQDITELKKVRIQFEQSLRALAQAHINMIEQGQSWMPDPQLNTQSGSQPATHSGSQPAPSAAAAHPSQVMAQPIAPVSSVHHATAQTVARVGFKAEASGR